MEMKTYRISGHYYGDNENYRTREEVAKWKEKDPITHCAALLTGEYSVSIQQLETIVNEEKAAVLDASEQAKGEPEPSAADIAKDVYDPTFKEIAWKAWAN